MALQARVLPPELEFMIISLLTQDLRVHRLGWQTDAAGRELTDRFERNRKYTTAFRLVCKRWDIAMRREIVSQLSLSEITAWSWDSALLCDAVDYRIHHSIPFDMDEALADLNQAANDVASAGCVPALKLLLDAGVNPDGELVHMAARGNHAGVIRLLASHGADLDYSYGFGLEHSALMEAVREDNLEAAVALMDSGANFQPPPDSNFRESTYTFLHWAAGNGNLVMMKEILDRAHATVDFVPAARLAIYRNSMEMLQLLVDYGFSPKYIPTPTGGSFLIDAIHKGNLSMFYRVLELGGGLYPHAELFEAIKRGQPEMVRALTTRGARVRPEGLPLLAQVAQLDTFNRIEEAKIVLEMYPHYSPELLEAAIKRYGDPREEKIEERTEYEEELSPEDIEVDFDAMDLFAPSRRATNERRQKKEYFEMLFEFVACHRSSDPGASGAETDQVNAQYHL